MPYDPETGLPIEPKVSYEKPPRPAPSPDGGDFVRPAPRDGFTKMDAKAAAEVIRADLGADNVVPPEAHHIHSFIEDVCEHLGIPPDHANMTHVAMLLEKHQIDPHRIEEYPKALTETIDGKVVPVKGPDGLDVVFASAEDEAAYAPANKPMVHNPVDDDQGDAPRPTLAQSQQDRLSGSAGAGGIRPRA